jgi:hypothetical protein
MSSRRSSHECAAADGQKHATHTTSRAIKRHEQHALTRVSLAFVEHRINLYLRFGHPVRELRLDRWRRCAILRARRSVLPRALGVQRLRYDTLAAHGAAGLHATRRSAAHRRHPARRAPVAVRRGRAASAVGAATDRRHRSARHRSGAVSPAYWRTLGNRLSARICRTGLHRRTACGLPRGRGAAMNVPSRCSRAIHRPSASLRLPGRRCTHRWRASSTTPATAYRLAGTASARLTRCTSAASCSPGFQQTPPRWLRSVATCPSTSRCSSASARCHRSRCASRSTSFASTACRWLASMQQMAVAVHCPAWQQCRRLHDGELFLLSATNPASFDSRYFGPIAVSAVIGSAQPLWTWGHAMNVQRCIPFFVQSRCTSLHHGLRLRCFTRADNRSLTVGPVASAIGKDGGQDKRTRHFGASKALSARGLARHALCQRHVPCAARRPRHALIEWRALSAGLGSTALEFMP